MGARRSEHGRQMEEAWALRLALRQTDRAERRLCLLGFKLARKLRQGEKRGVVRDDGDGSNKKGGGLKSVGERERLNESKFNASGGRCCFSGTV